VIFRLDQRLLFPPPEMAEPSGLLAVGGDLRPDRLVLAYAMGIFPWYSEGQPVLWWSPDPRAVLFPAEFRCTRSLAKTLRNGGFEVAIDRDFRGVIEACAAPRPHSVGTWITAEMLSAYVELHRRGYAHSIESYLGGKLVGGLYGVRLGGVFFGESMFSRERDASKVALARLVEACIACGIVVIDCQMASAHLESLGSRRIPRTRFQGLLREHVTLAPAPLSVGASSRMPTPAR
jgi:leucyl/phenylalanyl-tRNA---protein transferase